MPNERDFVLHSWCVPADWNAPTVVGGRGARLLLEGGREILDMSSLVECSNLGHQHPRLVAAIKAQAEQLCFVTSAWGAEPRAALAERLLELSGFEGGRVFFTLGGADANENAVRIARQASKKAARPRHHARPLVPRRELHGHGALGRQPHRAPGGRRGLGRAPRAAALRLSLSLRQHDAPMNAGAARPQAVARLHRHGRRGPRRRRADGSPTPAATASSPPDNYWPALRRVTRERGVLAGRRRSDERLRPLRRMVRLAAPRRGRTVPT